MIEKYEAGRFMQIKGAVYRHDLKIIDKRITGDWWRKEGHRLDEADMIDIIEAHPEIVIIGTGYAGNMQVPESTRSSLSSHGIRVIVKNTSAAVETFNRYLEEGRNVAGAFHLTC